MQATDVEVYFLARVEFAVKPMMGTSGAINFSLQIFYFKAASGDP